MKTFIIFLIGVAAVGLLLQCSPSASMASILWPLPSFEEGDFVTLKEGVQKARTYHCSRCSEDERFPCEFRYELYPGEIAQIISHEELDFWLDQTAFFPHCSYCRIVHAVKGAAWVDCSLLARVEMQEE